MSGKSSISKAQSYTDIGEFWDTRDLADEVGVLSEMTYYALDRELSEEVRSLARKRGVSADTLLNLWVQEKLQQIS